MKEGMCRDDMRGFGEIPLTTGRGYFSSVKRRARGRGTRCRRRSGASMLRGTCPM